MSEDVYRKQDGGVRLKVRLTPRASRNALDGMVDTPDGPAVQVRLNAPPVDGAANSALIAFLARELGMRKSDISIRAGLKSRIKSLELSGDPADLIARLNRLLGL